ncbi:MAG: hypothetical protein V2A73_07515 [Pseudomonadota bacterium]
MAMDAATMVAAATVATVVSLARASSLTSGAALVLTCLDTAGITCMSLWSSPHWHRPFLGALALQFVLVLVLENTGLSPRQRAVFE